MHRADAAPDPSVLRRRNPASPVPDREAFAGIPLPKECVMQVRNRVLLGAMLVCSLAGCRERPSPATSEALAAEASAALPTWMRSTEWAQRSWAKAPVGAVWRVRHAGRDAWLIDAPGTRARDTLVRFDGEVICNPAGFGGSGDGRCPTVVDAGTPPQLVWAHPGNPSPTFGPPPELALAPAETSSVVAHKPRPPRPPLPAWLETQVAAWERKDHGVAGGLAVSRLQHKGATAYLIHAGCCDRYDTLYDAEGRELCSPSGGHTGDGDGKCPMPEDPGTKRVLLWEHPGLPQH
jgi:hypothetical protein